MYKDNTAEDVHFKIWILENKTHFQNEGSGMPFQFPVSI